MSQNPVGRNKIDRDEVESLLAARQELGPAMEPALVDSMAQKIMAEVQRQTHMNVSAQDQQRVQQARDERLGSGGRLTLGIVSLVMAIPLTAIALEAGSWMAVVVWIGIVLVNFAYNIPRGGKP